MKCAEKKEQYEQIFHSAVLLPLAGGISLALYCLIFYLYFIVKVPPLKRHPTSLVVQKCIWEAINVVQYLWIPLIDKSYFYNNDDSCAASNNAAIWAFISQVSHMAGNLQLLILAVDLRRSSSNPFEAYQLRERYYLGFVWLISLSTGLILLALGGDTYGLASNMTCWIQSSNEYFFLDTPKLLLFFIVVYAVWLYAAYVVIVVLRRLRRGLRNSLSNRISIIRRSQMYVLGYVVIGLFQILIELGLFLKDYYAKDADDDHTHDDNLHQALRTFVAVLDACMGCVSFAILYIPNRGELKAFFHIKEDKKNGFVANAVLEDLSLKPHLNFALRAEILYYTTLGIRLASHTEISKKEGNGSNIKGKPHLTVDHDKETSAVTGTGTPTDALKTPLVDSHPGAGGSGSGIGDNARGEWREREEDSMNSSRFSFIFTGPGGLGSEASTSKTFFFQGFNIKATIHASMKLFMCTEVVDDPDEEAGLNSSSIGMRSSHLTTASSSSRLSELGALQDQQRASVMADLTEGVEEALESFRYSSQDEYLLRGVTMPATHSTDASPDSDFKRMSVRDFALSKFKGTRDRIKERIIKAAQNGQTLLQDTLPAAFVFQDFKSDLFSEVKRYCGIDPVEYADSFRNVTKEKFSEGASGAFLYFSSDQKYIVKTTSLSDLESLLEMMPAYVSHLDANPNSLIVRYLGAHCVTLYKQKLYFVVMKNIFSQLHLSERYDLKGSWVNRHRRDANVGKKKARRGDKEDSKCPLYLDNDLQHKIHLQPSVANAMHNQIFRDSTFLRGLNMMDYSLLVGVTRKAFDVMEGGPLNSNNEMSDNIHLIKHESTPLNQSGCASGDTQYPRQEDIFLRDKDGGMHAVVVHGPATYYFGIIDILQQYNWRKKLERFVKIVFLRRDGDGLSALDPQRYSERLMRRCVDDVFENLHIHSTDDFLTRKMTSQYRVSLSRDLGCQSDVDNPLLRSQWPAHRRPYPQTSGSYLLKEEGKKESNDNMITYAGKKTFTLPTFLGEEKEEAEGELSEQRRVGAWGKDISHDI